MEWERVWMIGRFEQQPHHPRPVFVGDQLWSPRRLVAWNLLYPMANDKCKTETHTHTEYRNRAQKVGTKILDSKRI